MDDSQVTFERAGWVIGQLLQGCPESSLPLEVIDNGWAGALAAIQGAAGADRHAAFEYWCAEQPEDGQPYKAAVFKWKPEDPDPASVDLTQRVQWTADELLTTDFPDPVWTIPGLLPAGLAILAGRPKVGKSWLALQWAHAIASGGMVFDEHVERRHVLYLALEDGPQRLKARLQKQCVGLGADLEFAFAWPTFGTEGGMTMLHERIKTSGAEFVVIDTLSRALGGRADQMDIGVMTELVGELQKIALSSEITILAIDHHRKNGGFEGDAVDDIMGSSAKAAVADCAMGIYKERGKQGATLKITGRELEEKELALEFDGLTCSWQLLGDAGDVRKDTVKAEILEAIQTLTDLGEITSPTNIAKYMGKDRGNVSRELADLLNQGFVVKLDKVGQSQPYQVVGSE